MRKKILALAMITAVSAAHAGGGAFGGATEPTQLLNNGELIGINSAAVEQIANQVQMITYQLRMLQTTGDFSRWPYLIDSINQLGNVIARAQGVAATSANVETVFNEKYPGYGNQPGNYDFNAAYRRWINDNQSQTRSLIEAAGLQYQQMADESARLEYLKSLASNPQGQTQAVQVASQIAAMEVEQLQKLRQLQIAQAQQHANYIASKQQLEADEKERFKRATQFQVTSDGTFTPR